MMSWFHRLLFAPALVSLLLAAWAGLLRLGWALPPLPANDHGPLIISGFLGTLIALERAVALSASFKRGYRAYAAPLLSAVGALSLVLGAPRQLSISLITLGSVGLCAIFVAIIHRQRALFAVTMALGALCWLVGNIFWLMGQPIFRFVEWWIAFLVLTIAGERLELTRILRHPPASQIVFVAIIGAYLGGLTLTTLQMDAGPSVIGVSLVALGVWLFRYDIARKTVRQAHLTRYIAFCLLAGYVWLIVGGVLRVALKVQIAGPYYDALLHSVLLGFVFSMIFGHAPIILPSVLKVSLPFNAGLYLPLIVLHGSLLVRLIGDLAIAPTLRQWGGMVNVIAVLMFLGSTAFVVVRPLLPRLRHANRSEIRA